MTFLLTYFEPFGGSSINSSARPCQVAAGILGEKHDIFLLELPCVYDQAALIVIDIINRISPDYVLLTGQSGGREELNIERIFINLDEASLADNAGELRSDSPIRPGAPAAYFSTIPAAAGLHAIRQLGIPATLSTTAGTFVCNHTGYELMRHLSIHAPEVLGGFLHIPYTPEQVHGSVNEPSMNSDIAARGVIALMLTTMGEEVVDLDYAGLEHE